MRNSRSSKRLIEDNFSRYAESYDDHSAVQRYCGKKVLDMMGEIAPSDILEAGCGTGAFTSMLRDKWADARISAVDISERMLEAARYRFSGVGGVKFIKADAETLDIFGEPDLITSNASFQWFENLDRTFGIFKDKLKDGGVFCFSMYGPETFRELKAVLGEHFGARKWLSSSKFVPADILKMILRSHFDKIEFREEYFLTSFHGLMDLLKGIKHSGTRGEGLGGSFFLGKYAVSEMEKTYIRQFGEVIATHHVYFCRAVKGRRSS